MAYYSPLPMQVGGGGPAMLPVAPPPMRTKSQQPTVQWGTFGGRRPQQPNSGGGGGQVPLIPGMGAYSTIGPTFYPNDPRIRRSGTSNGGNNNLLNQMFNSYQQAHDSANAANQARYEEVVNGLNNRYARGLTNLQGMGDQAITDANAQYKALSGAVNQNLIDRGLMASTVHSANQRGVERDRQNAIGRINESVRAQRLATDAQLSGDVLSAIERREDVGPSYDQMIALAQMAGQGGYGYGSSGGGRSSGGGYSGFVPAGSTYAMQHPGSGGRYTQKTVMAPGASTTRKLTNHPTNYAELMAMVAQGKGTQAPQGMAGWNHARAFGY